MAKRQAPYPLRIPDELREWVKKRAVENMRSMNAELTLLLTGLKDKLEKPKG